MAIETWRRQHIHTIDGDALALVDGGGIAVIDIGIVLHVEPDRTAIIHRDGHAGGADAFDSSHRSVLHAKAVLVAQEQDTVASAEQALAAAGDDLVLDAKFVVPAKTVSVRIELSK